MVSNEMGIGSYGNTIEVWLSPTHWVRGVDRANPFTGAIGPAWNNAMTDVEFEGVERFLTEYGAALGGDAIEIAIGGRGKFKRPPRVVLHGFTKEAGGCAQLFGDFDACCAFVYGLTKAGDLIAGTETSSLSMVTSSATKERARVAFDEDVFDACVVVVTSAIEFRSHFGTIIEC